ncbi:hypothetical protein DH2020_020074 [Rehmannia glutinosa]|uniref:PUM-HD domain-containing protein n=1 Tax=Rehmannia glutinosa TaxID=99300 RepID=A0ABR0WJW7_REHGL
MAAKPQKKSSESKKRKRIPNQKPEESIANSEKSKLTTSSKKLKLTSSNAQNNVTKKPFKVYTKDYQKPSVKKDEVDTKKLGRLRAKELAEARKKKRKKHYSLEQELALLWEKMRCRNIAKEDRSRWVTEALKKMKGKISEIASSHVSSRVLQHAFAVIEHAYNLGNATQKQALLMELYSPELQLFKDLVTGKENRLEDVISKLQLQKSSVLRHMTSVLQPILEKGILDHSIVHRAFMEYLSIADPSSAADVIQQLSGASLVRMIHTKDGSRLGQLCIRHGSAKERKKIIKGMKGHVDKIAHDKFGNMIIIRELEGNLKELLLDQSESDGGEAVEEDTNGEDDPSDSNIQLNEGGKKDSFKRRQELLVNSGLAEVATGGADGILHPTLDAKLAELHEAIASIAAQPKPDEPEKEHILENFHSSRAIRKLVLDCPAFASTLWEKALKGNCAIWAKGFSSKVINAFLETSDSAVKELAKEELQPLIERGDLSLPVVE